MPKRTMSKKRPKRMGPKKKPKMGKKMMGKRMSKKGSMGKKGRCWDGYKPTPGKKPYSKGSCTKA